jgi:hypothetical protein
MLDKMFSSFCVGKWLLKITKKAKYAK